MSRARNTGAWIPITGDTTIPPNVHVVVLGVDIEGSSAVIKLRQRGGR